MEGGREDDFEEFDGVANQTMRVEGSYTEWGERNEGKYVGACDDEGGQG